MVTIHHVTALLTNQKQALSMATYNDSYHQFCCWRIMFYINTSCFRKKLSYQQVLSFSLEKLDSHSGETGNTVVKQDSPPYILFYHCKIGCSHYWTSTVPYASMGDISLLNTSCYTLVSLESGPSNIFQGIFFVLGLILLVCLQAVTSLYKPICVYKFCLNTARVRSLLDIHLSAT